MIILIRGVEVEIENMTQDQYDEVRTRLVDNLSNSKKKNREVIADSFGYAVSLCPGANPSDLWHHVIYRDYVDLLSKHKTVYDPVQSWKRASGDAFELFLENYYNRLLQGTNVRILALLGRTNQIVALKRLGIYGKVGDSKLDIAILANAVRYGIPGIGDTVSINEGDIIGGIHAKTSLAERVSDDVPASLLMMKNGYMSILATLDVKSFPVSETMSGEMAYFNKGELGSPNNPTDKRRYIEEHGSFDICISYNLRSNPSQGKTPSGKNIYVSSLDGTLDALYNFLKENYGAFQEGE